MPKLSIITVCYNIKDDIERTCKSIVNQTFQDFEWLVIDGGSTDGTVDILNRYKDRINVFISEKDNGIYNAMNKGIKLAKGEYLNFMNGGDSFFYDDALKDVFQDKQRTSDVLYGNAYLDEDNIDNDSVWIMPKTLDKTFLIKSCLNHQSSFVKRELFNTYGLYSEEYKIASDYDKWFVFLGNNVSFEYLPYITAKCDTKGISSRKDTRNIAISERKKVCLKHVNPEEYKSVSYKNSPMKYHFMERLFSIKNSPDTFHKVFTILGLKLKIRRHYS